jgi:beta-lactam-binding protein with PASTA domain
MTASEAATTARRQRRALLLACADFSDPHLPTLRSPGRDAEALKEVLSDPTGPRYEVTSEVNCTAQEAQVAIESFFSQARPDDVHLLYFSCRGIQDPRGDLFFAFTDTRRELPGSTAVSAEWVRARMQASRSRTTIVLIDCCFSGAFLRGMRSRSGTDANVSALVRDLPEGTGVAVITASGETEFSLEDASDRIAAAVKPSYFTEAVVTGIGTGAADRSGNGRITVDDLYDYVYQRIVAGPSPQRPRKMGQGEGQVLVAEVARTRPEPPLPPAPPEGDATAVLQLDELLIPWPPLPTASFARVVRPVDLRTPTPDASTTRTRTIGVAHVPPSTTRVAAADLKAIPAPPRSFRRIGMLVATVTAATCLIAGILWLTLRSPGTTSHTAGVAVPSIMGLNVSDAESSIKAAGLSPVAGSTGPTAACRQGTVTQQLPEAGQTVSPGSTITYATCGSQASTVSVPPVVGSTAADAETALKAAGLRYGVASVHSSNPIGRVSKTSPTPGTTVPIGTTVTLTVPKWHVDLQMLDLQGLTQAAATAQLENDGFTDIKPIKMITNDPQAVGRVFDQSPEPGTTVRYNAEITLDVFVIEGSPSELPSSPQPSVPTG